MDIRAAHGGDHDAMYTVCLRTGASGADATSLYVDPLLIGELYVGPYLALQPDLAWALTDGVDIVGYVLGALRTDEFEERCEREWWPSLRRRYPDPASIPRSERSPDQQLTLPCAMRDRRRCTSV